MQLRGRGEAQAVIGIAHGLWEEAKANRQTAFARCVRWWKRWRITLAER